MHRAQGRGLSMRASTSSSAPAYYRSISFASSVFAGMWCQKKESCACLFHSLRLWCFHISLQHIFPAFSRNVQKCRDLFSVRSRERLKSRVPESTSQLLLNREETNANAGPKWRQIWTSYKIHKKFVFYANRKNFSLKFLGWCLDSDIKIKKIPIWAL